MKTLIHVAHLVYCCALMMRMVNAAEDKPGPNSPEHLSASFFEKITVEADCITIKFHASGERFIYKKNNGQLEKSEYGQEISVKVGESLTLTARHHSVQFQPLPEPIRPYGFDVIEEFDGRSGGGKLTSTRVFIVTAKVKGPSPFKDSGIVILEPSLKAIEGYLKKSGNDLLLKGNKTSKESKTEPVRRIGLLEAVVGPEPVGFETPFRVIEGLLQSIKKKDYKLYVATLAGEALKDVAVIDRAHRDFDERNLLYASYLFERDCEIIKSVKEIRYYEKDNHLWADIQAAGDVDKRLVVQKMTVRFINTSNSWRLDRVEKKFVEQEKPSDSSRPAK